MKLLTVQRLAVLIVVSLAALMPPVVQGGEQSDFRSGTAARTNKLEKSLIDHIALVPKGTPIKVVVVLIPELQLQEKAKRTMLRTVLATNQVQRMREQRRVMIQELKGLAATGQNPLLDYLRPLQTNGVVRGIRPLWLSNLIGLEAPAEVLYRLASSNEVDYIHLDLPRRVSLASGGRIAPGIKQIHANNVHPSPNNQNVIVAVLDTGADITQPDLAASISTKANFSGGSFDDVTDSDGHGTFVAGIIAGNGTGGTNTGVFPHSHLMILKKSSTTDKTTEMDCWAAMEYAATNNALIVNFSSGWRDPFDHPDSGSWRRNVQNLTDANVLFVAAAGDSGNDPSLPPPTNVAMPAETPAALAVGAVDGAVDSQIVVPAFSSQGPVTWINVDNFNDYPNPPGLIKPDLVAPGAPVLSLKLGEGYRSDNGTSFAAPYVSGVAALLLAQNPALGPYDLRFILEESAAQSTGGAQNVTLGWGLVDAKKALNLTYDSNTPYDLTVGNVGVNASPDPKNPQPTPLSACVTNLGGQVVGNVEMRFYYTDAVTASVSDLDPNGDGDPSDSKFEYIGSYFVPVVGPAQSRHATFTGTVVWAPKPRQNKWWIGVWVLPGATSQKELNFQNNGVVVPLPP